MSIRRRLTVLYAVAMLAVVLPLIILLVIIVIRSSSANVTSSAQADTREVALLLTSGRSVDATQLDSIAGGTGYLIVRTASGTVVAESTENLDGFNDVSAAHRNVIWRKALSTGAPARGTFDRVYDYALPVSISGTTRYVVETWASYQTTGASFIPFTIPVIIAIPISIVIAVVASYVLVGATLAPVDAITRATHTISETDLARRIPVETPTDEFGRLATTFNDLLARLEAAFADREAALIRQRRFVADASHELRTPLTSISGYTRLLRSWGLSDRIVATESLAALDTEVVRMRSLVEGLLVLANGDETPRLELVRTDLSEILSETVSATRVSVPRGVEITLELPEIAPIVMADLLALNQLLVILLENAIKYSGESNTIRVRLASTASHALISIEDHGIGIASEHLPRLFDRFFRVDEARSDGGFGLGLSIARQIAAAHEAVISVESRFGIGSTFTVTIPCDSAKNPGRATSVARPGWVRNTLT